MPLPVSTGQPLDTVGSMAVSALSITPENSTSSAIPVEGTATARRRLLGNVVSRPAQADLVYHVSQANRMQLT